MSKLIPLLETLFLNKGGSPQLWLATQDVLSQKADEARNFCLFMKTKLRDMNQETQLLALDFLDYSVDKGKMPLWTQVGTKDFLMCLITLLKTRDIVDVQTKILFLIEKWGKKFDHFKEILPTYKEVYTNLKSAGVTFPTGYSSMYSKYSDSKKDSNPSQNYNESDYKNDIDDDDNFAYGQDDPNKNHSVKSSSNNNSSYSEIYTKLGLQPNLFEKKYNKLVLKLIECSESIILSNDMIDNAKLGQVEDVLRTIIHDLRHDNSQIIETISSDKLKDERLMELSLGISEDISRTLKRYDSIKKQRKPEPLLSYFLENSDPQIRSIPKDKPTQHQHQPQPQPQLNLFDDFDNPPQVTQPKFNPPSSSLSSSNANDLLDLFSNPQPVNNNPYHNMPKDTTNTNAMSNQQNLREGSFDLFGSINNNNNPIDLQQQQQHGTNIEFNQSGNIFDQISSNTQPNVFNNENKRTMLSDQLKMAYGNNTNDTNINMSMNNGMSMGNINVNMNQPTMNTSLPIYNNMNYMKPPDNLMNMPQPKLNSSYDPRSNTGTIPVMSNQQMPTYSMNQFNQNQPSINNSNVSSTNNINFNQLPTSNMGFNQNQSQNQSQNIPNPYDALFN